MKTVAKPKRKRPREWWLVLYEDGVVYATLERIDYALSAAKDIDGTVVRVREVTR
jgi:hypothetical protein